jgi:alpha-tubulin suppressor-like RCC1 family protein
MIVVSLVFLIILVVGTIRAGFTTSFRMAFQVTLPFATIIYYTILVTYGALANLGVVLNYQTYIQQLWTYRPVVFLVIFYILVVYSVGMIAVQFMRNEPVGRAVDRRRIAWAAAWYQRHGAYTIVPWILFALLTMYALIAVSQIVSPSIDIQDMTYAILSVGFLLSLAMLMMPRAERIIVVTGHTTSLFDIAEQYIIAVQEIVDYNYITRNSPIFNRGTPTVVADWRTPLHIGTVLRIPPETFINVPRQDEPLMELVDATENMPQRQPTQPAPPTAGGREVVPPNIPTPQPATRTTGSIPVVTNPVSIPPQPIPVPSPTQTVTDFDALRLDLDAYANMLPTVVGVAAGAAHSLVLLSDGQLLGWGDNRDNQITIPDAVIDADGANLPARATEVRAYNNFSVLLLVSGTIGTIRVWGDLAHGQENVPSNEGTFQMFHTVMAGGGHIVAINTVDNRLYAWGNNSHGQCDVPENKHFIAMACGDNHTAAITEERHMLVWGDNAHRQCETPTEVSDVRSVAAGANHTVVLLNNGEVIAWGDNSTNQCDVPTFPDAVIAISAGRQHSAALCSNGQVVVWGDAQHAVVQVPVDVANVRMITSGAHHMLAVTNDNQVLAWGDNQFGQCAVPALPTVSPTREL